MALMTSIRERMHVVLWSLLFLFLLSMTVGGLVGGANIIDELFGNVNPQTTIARINGQDISPDQFNNIVSQQLQSSRSAGQIISDQQMERARNTAWENLLQDILVSQEVEKLKLSSTNEEVIWHLENNPPPFLTQNPNFQTDGNFDIIKYREALANPQGNEWAPIESFMKDTYIPNYKLQKMIDESIVITLDDLKNEYVKKNTNYTISCAHITSAQIKKENLEVSSDEIRNEYMNNNDDYKHSELRSISYVSWRKEPSPSDSLNAKELAMNLYERAKSGEDFSTLANEYSMDPSNQNTRGGDLGWFKEGKMVKSFDDAAFKAKKNQIVGPVSSNFGYHIIYVRDKKVSENGSNEVLASHILIRIEISPTTISNIKKEAIIFSYDAQDFGFEKALTEHQLAAKSYNRFNDSEYTVQGLGGLRAAVRFAFNNKINDVSDILENNEFFVICKLDSVIESGIKNFEVVKTQIENKLKREKTKQATLEEANNLLIKLSSKDMSISELIEEEKKLEGFGKESKTLAQGFKYIGRSNYVNGALLNAKLGDLMGPLETNRGQAIIELIEVEEFDSTEFATQKEQIRNSIYARKQSQFFQAWIEELKTKAEIIDNRKYYF